ncbi:ankyrin repeat domain-containing protein [Wolbachia endosymbiont (group A) of Pogonocherus hispidulus]|uniref:ankyrin repeat domain-containing protein n=1 Tax=Wolbachia endosymbiont (group A) of Pogonocherus hispidulus TaxID=3066136 RepID=UPI00333F7904
MLQSKWKEALSAVDADNDLNESNVIDKIKEKLKAADQSEYERWKKFDFDLAYLLHKAVRGNFIEIVSALIEKGANVNAIDTVENTPLLVAVERGYIEIVSTLIEKGADVNVEGGFHSSTPLYCAIERNNAEIVKSLVEKGADVNAADLSSQYAPLHCTARYGNAEIVKSLVEKGADVNAVDLFSQCTPLHYAARHGSAEIVKFLVEKGADVTRAVSERTLCTYRLSLDVGEVLVRHILIKNPRMKKPNSVIEKLSEYWDRCLDEVKRLEEEENKPLYDFLKASNTNTLISMWKKDESVRGKFDNQESLQEQYPEYAHTLIDQANKVKKEIFLHSHKPLIDALSTYYEYDLKKMTFDDMKKFFEMHRDKIVVEFGGIEKSLIEFVDFKDIKEIYVPKLELQALAARIIHVNSNLKHPDSEQHQGLYRSRF